MDQTIEIFIDQLVSDDEFRQAFFRNPRTTLRLAGDWGVPLSDSEIESLLAKQPSLWDCIAEMVIDRLQQAA